MDRRFARSASIALLALGCAGWAACAGLRPEPGPAPGGSGTTLIRALNRSRGPVEVWIFALFQVRLGRVEAGRVAEYVVPADLPAGEGSIRLVAWPRAAQPYASEPILLFPGRVVRWTIHEATPPLRERLRAVE